MKQAIALLLSILMVLSLSVGMVSAEEDFATIGIQLLSTPSAVGDTVTVQVSLKNITAKKYYASDVALYYNPTVLKCTAEPSMSKELADSGIMTKVFTETDHEKGIVQYVIGMTPEGYREEGYAVPSGNLELFTVTFEVIGQGNMNLQLAARNTAPAYAEHSPNGADLYLGELLKKASFDSEAVSQVIGEKGDALISQILPLETITVPYGTEDVMSFLPKTVSVKLDDGSVKEMGITWSGYMSSYDPTVAGTYMFRGELIVEEGYKNNLGLYSLLTVVMKEKGNTSGDESTTPTQPTQPTQPTEPTKPTEPDQPDQPGQTVLFTDLDTVPWASAKILELANKGAISGVSEGLFAPEEAVTRAQFAAILARAFDLLDKDASCDFKDVSKQDWYYSAVASAKKAGITAGYEDNTFRPDALITRQEMAAMAYRVAGIAGLILPSTGEKITFSDETEMEGYAKDLIYAMQQAGIINGLGDGRFGPAENATRAQAAVIICNLTHMEKSQESEK